MKPVSQEDETQFYLREPVLSFQISKFPGPQSFSISSRIPIPVWTGRSPLHPRICTVYHSLTGYAVLLIWGQFALQGHLAVSGAFVVVTMWEVGNEERALASSG